MRTLESDPAHHRPTSRQAHIRALGQTAEIGIAFKSVYTNQVCFSESGPKLIYPFSLQAGLIMGPQADRLEAELFAKQSTHGIKFQEYSDIQVDVTGPKAKAAPALENFSDLGGVLPDFLSRNISLMRYAKPTPIQRHSIPLALAGVDLMCCAQTGSGSCCQSFFCAI